MEKREILNLNNHKVYYVKDDNISYYLTIPKYQTKTQLCIELKSKMSNYNLDISDEVWVIENVKNTYSYIDDYNITLILPIINEEDRSILEKIDTTKYGTVDKIIAMTLNSAYMILKEANQEIDSQILLVNNDRYQTFINWFKSRYKNRVDCENMLEIIQKYNVNATSYKKIETHGMTFVVGNYNNEIDAPRVVHEEEPVTNQKLVPKASYGFTSYWLLVTITIVVAGIVAVIAFTMK